MQVPILRHLRGNAAGGLAPTGTSIAYARIRAGATL